MLYMHKWCIFFMKGYTVLPPPLLYNKPYFLHVQLALKVAPWTRMKASTPWSGVMLRIQCLHSKAPSNPWHPWQCWTSTVAWCSLKEVMKQLGIKSGPLCDSYLMKKDQTHLRLSIYQAEECIKNRQCKRKVAERVADEARTVREGTAWFFYIRVYSCPIVCNETNLVKLKQFICVYNLHWWWTSQLLSPMHWRVHNWYDWYALK